MKHVVIVHGWKGRPETNWKPWLKDELEKSGNSTVDVPAMPHSEHPVASEWVQGLAHAVSQPTSETYLVGHSLGCITILRYLETLKNNQKIRAAILVAGFGQRFKGYQGQHDSFFDHDLDWQSIRKHCDHFVTIYSDDDPFIKIDQMELFKDKLGAKGIVVHGMGHFGSADNVFKLPVVRDELFKLNHND